MASVGGDEQRKAGRPAIDAAVQVLARLLEEETGSRNFRVQLICDQSGFRYEVTNQMPRQRWD
jgi:hypothetical protein